jgi:glutamate-ammonia-ligase adenylyltransferase
MEALPFKNTTDPETPAFVHGILTASVTFASQEIMPDDTPHNAERHAAKIKFRDPESAARNLTRLQLRTSADVYRRLQLMLADSPDPDSVIVLLDRLLDVTTEGVRARLLEETSLLSYACLIFGQSRWLSETVIRNPSILRRLQRGELDRALSREEFREEFGRRRNHPESENLSLSLAKFRKAAYVRILLRDLLGIAKTAEITEEISTLSDVLIEEALRAANSELSRLYGRQRWMDCARQSHVARAAIVSLGKLGGCELNYSSDVDLMFLYEGGGEIESSILTNREYFIRLAECTTSLLSQPTAEGHVLRIDLRLRPEGSGGDPAVSLSRAIRYYSEIAQDWELQAMIKARHTAGDVSLTREFLRAIEPAVYRPNINFAAVKTALQARERIDRRNRTMVRKGRTSVINVKLDRGGIRDIEFLVQCLQRVYGGEESWLRSRGTLSALQKLQDKNHISGKDFHTLTKAYEFLRNLEHRLQLRQGQQVHQLPESEVELEWLSRSLTVRVAGSRSGGDFLEEVRSQMAEVANIYQRVVYVDQDGGRLERKSQSRSGVEAPVSAEDSYSQAMQRLSAEAPQLMAELSQAKLSQHARRNLGRFLNSAATGPERFAAVLRSPQPLQRALRIFESSEFLTNLLVYNPAGIELLDPSRVADMFISKPSDLGAAQQLLRKQYRNAVLNVNSRDVFERCNIWEILSENTRIADEALRFALTVSGEPLGFAVMALGRLGSCEFDIMSDADLLFVAGESADLQLCRRAAEQLLELLAAFTLDGTVFSIDARLRPQGSQGELVTSVKRLEQYFDREAKAWEGLTYLRLRYIAGTREVAEQAIESVSASIARMARKASFSDELGQMRRRLEQSDVAANLKTGPGGTYDTDYLVGLLQARHGIWANGNLLDRVHVVEACGLLGAEEARQLAENVEFLRSFEHIVRLVTGQCGKWMPKSEHAGAKVMELARFPESDVRSLEGRLVAVMGSARAVYQKYLFD